MSIVCLLACKTGQTPSSVTSGSAELRPSWSNTAYSRQQSAVPGVETKDSQQIITLKHGWTTHGTSWDFDTDVKFLMFGPGFVKQGIRLEKTTLQNIAPTYAKLLGIGPPRGSMGRVMSEALVNNSNRPRVIFTVIIDGAGRSVYRTWPDALAHDQRLAARGVEYLDAKVTQIETATNPSHTSVGTGGYPFTHHIVGNVIRIQPRTG